VEPDTLLSDDAIALIQATSRGYPRGRQPGVQSLLAAYTTGEAIVDETPRAPPVFCDLLQGQRHADSGWSRSWVRRRGDGV
jgi:hypothetical protein